MDDMGGNCKPVEPQKPFFDPLKTPFEVTKSLEGEPDSNPGHMTMGGQTYLMSDLSMNPSKRPTTEDATYRFDGTVRQTSDASDAGKGQHWSNGSTASW